MDGRIDQATSTLIGAAAAQAETAGSFTARQGWKD
jgi:hypothetical protein